MKQVTTCIFLFSLLFSCSESPDDLKNKEVIVTENRKDNDDLFSRFITDLKKEKFAIEKFKLDGSGSWHDTKRAIDIVVEGEGNRWYYIKRTEAEPENYYPDFVLNVFEFSDEAEAKLWFDKISAALKSPGRYPNGKAPQTVVYNKNEVFCLFTGAEMYRGYINDFAKRIESY